MKILKICSKYSYCIIAGVKKLAYLKDITILVEILWINESVVMTNDVGWDGGVLMFLQNARDRR